MLASRPDLIIAGGGLAGGLAALTLRQRRPDLAVTLIEAGERVGGNHLWSYFESDIAQADRPLLDSLTAHRWPGYEVCFPSHRRQIGEPYRTIPSEALDRAVRASGVDVIQGDVAEVAAQSVRLGGGQQHSAGAVLDARGIGGVPAGLDCGWQKFVGKVLTIDGGHGLTKPVVMDGTVTQLDGYRFVYLLPFDANRVFVEDTYYSDGPELDDRALTSRIAEYAAGRGWQVASTERTEHGVLPVVTGGDFDHFWPEHDDVARAGVRAGLFHPLTSYSLPDAVRFAAWLAERPDFHALGRRTRDYARRHWQAGRFDRMLARMLMRAAAPGERYRVLERFYRLPAPLIARFYAGRSTSLDRLRILSGKPPVPLVPAIRAIMERA